MPASEDEFCHKLLRGNESMDALGWLEKGAHRGFSLGELGPAESMSMVRRAYLAGAERVYVFDFYEQADTGFEHSDRLIVALPTEATQRANVFEWARSIGHEPEEDTRQQFLRIHLA